MKNTFVVTLLVSIFLVACSQKLDSPGATIESKSNKAPSESINPPKETDSIQSAGKTSRELSLYKENASLQESLAILNSEYQDLKRKSSNFYTLIDEDCTLNCLFKANNGNNDPIGIAVIKGYYSPIEREAWGTTKKCDGFTITGGSKDLSQAMVKLVDDGNTVHSKNELNQPVINLGLSLMSEAEKQNIFNSTESDQIELIVLRAGFGDKGALACHAFLTVLRIR